MVLFIGFFGINQLNIFYAHQELEFEKTDFNRLNKESEIKDIKSYSSSKRYAKFGLNEEMATQIYYNLKELMRRKEKISITTSIHFESKSLSNLRRFPKTINIL